MASTQAGSTRATRRVSISSSTTTIRSIIHCTLTTLESASSRLSSIPPSFSWHSTPLFFFFNDTATTEIYTLSLHDALPFFLEEHASHLHSLTNLVCRLLL